MRSASEPLIKRLKIGEAIAAEAVSTRNLVPSEIGWDKIVANSKDIEKWISSSLRAGFYPSGQLISVVRKVQGTRPVPLVGPLERVMLRALTTAILGESYKVDRSPEAYAKFIKAPLEYGFELQREKDALEQKRKKDGQAKRVRLLRIFDSPVKYVVKSDITAFYQYVDHALLGEELRVLGGDFEAIELLLELLSEIQGRRFGLPQLLDASDLLSDVYIDRVERTLIRKGVPVWRFNDDFRIACLSYNEALAVVEQLDSAARENGLVISESKTFTFGFGTYAVDNISKGEIPEDSALDLDDVETVVGDYTDDFADEPEAARSVVSGAKPRESDGNINLGRMTAEDLRLLRRAIAGLVKNSDPGCIDDVVRLIIYVPALTPLLLKYLTVVHDISSEQVVDAIDSIIGTTSLNEWQCQWVLHALRSMDLLAEGSGGDVELRLSWTHNKRRDADSLVTQSHALLCLASADKVDLNVAISVAEAAPSGVLTWLAAALCVIRDRSGDPASAKQVEAFGRLSPLHKVLVAP